MWLVLIAALLSAFNAFFRYFINEIIVLARQHDQLGLLQGLLDWYGNNSNAFLEAQWYMFGVMAMFGAAYTLKVNEHVRVDLVYGFVSERTRTWIDLIGGIFCLVPMCALLAYLTWPWFVEVLAQRRGFHQCRRSRALARQIDFAAGFRAGAAAGLLRNHQMRRRSQD